MNNIDMKNAFGEWLCNMLSHPIVKAGIHAGIRNEYEQDYMLVTELYNDFWHTAAINMKTIDGAKKWYIHNNKSLLEISTLTDDQKKEVSDNIEFNAETLKQKWIQAFEDRGIRVLRQD